MTFPNAPSNWIHDRDHVRLLHNAHADHIESAYQAMAKLPGNPSQVIIRRIGPTRTFIAAGIRLENRAIFTGEEDPNQIDRVLQHFADHAANCVIEVNPANFYVNPPVSWDKPLLKHLLSRGCFIDDMRCVWHRNAPPSIAESPSDGLWRRFGPEEIQTFIEISRSIDPQLHWTPADIAAESHSGRFHYVGYDSSQPAAVATLFVHDKIGYLQWCRTHPDHRRKGLQQAAINVRVRDAFAFGCERVFTVTDFNFSSPRNLQRCGFHLAYNYLLVRRDPKPLAHLP
jgi:GNAT superfamily N-acetyltransferase